MICTITPAAPLTYFTDGKGGLRDFWVYERCGDFFGLHKKHLWDFFGYCFFLSAQINYKISAIYCWCGSFLDDYAKNVGIFLGRQIVKLGYFWV